MQALPHSMAHRSAAASRTNARWHPYTPPRASGASTPGYGMLAPSSCTPHHSIQQQNSQDHPYLITPASSVCSVSPLSQSPHPLASTSSCSQIHTSTQIPQTRTLPVPNAQTVKANYVASLVCESGAYVDGCDEPQVIDIYFTFLFLVNRR